MAEKLTIFISGTMRDLPEERARVAATIREMGHKPIWAEKRGATNRPSRNECERMARTCDIYLGLYGLPYGWKPPGETISATEFEWQTVKRAGKPMLIYRQKGQPDPEQEAFLNRVGDWPQGRFWYEFETLDDLLPRLRDDLARLIAESFRPQRPALLADYRVYLHRLYADLPLAGIPIPLDVTLPLDRVYIKLRVLPEREEAARREAALPWDSDEELPRKLAEWLWSRREEWEKAARRMEKARPIPPEEAIARHHRLAILGEGAGCGGPGSAEAGRRPPGPGPRRGDGGRGADVGCGDPRGAWAGRGGSGAPPGPGPGRGGEGPGADAGCGGPGSAGAEKRRGVRAPAGSGRGV